MAVGNSVVKYELDEKISSYTTQILYLADQVFILFGVILPGIGHLTAQLQSAGLLNNLEDRSVR